MSEKAINILLLGSGGREHAIAWKLNSSTKVNTIYVAPGNGGTHLLNKVKNVNIPISNFKELTQFAIDNKVDLVIPGPEQPLVDGVKEYFDKVGIPVFGPSQKAAQLEGSKAYSKIFMEKYNIPTARYQNFTDYESAKQYLLSLNYNVVIKASGLAAGKGVLIPETKEQALKDLEQVMVYNIFGEAGKEVVIEEFLEGEELSLLAFSDGYTVVPLLPSQDHKRAYDGDKGPNTGGMGCYAPTPIGTPELMKQMYDQVLLPTLKGMRSERAPFVGMLFVGIMVTSQGPKVLEYNVRFGDPETEVVLPLLKSDLVEIMLACVEHRLDTVPVEFEKGSAATVVIASGGYPNQYKKGLPINIKGSQDGSITVFHAGTQINNDVLVSSGGRVLTVTGCGSTIELALKKAYEGVELVELEGSFYRKDIGHKALNYQPTKLTYSQAGVSIDNGNLLVDKIKKVVKSTKRLGSDSDIGGFGGLFDIKKVGYKDPILVSATDGVGTKLAVAHKVDKHDTIGIDLVAMSVNDLIVQGAEPLFFLDYFACGKLQVETTANVVSGVAKGCVDSGCALVGGETAEMPGLYNNDEYDLAGFAVGAVEREHVLPKMELIEDGDILVGLPSSGPHSNGYSLLRKIQEKSQIPYEAPAPFDSSITLGEAMLTPTKLYVLPLLPLIKQQKIIGMAHITGGGFIDNIPRVLPSHLAVTLDAKQWPINPIFKWAKQVGNIDNSEMARTFNCGIGMVLIVKQNNVKDVMSHFESINEPAYIIGNIHKLTENQVTVLNMESEW